ncbi:DNA helicase [Bertholletia excelsa]
MAEEETNLLDTRVKEEEEEGENESKVAPHLNDTQVKKLDEILTQIQLYSEFVLEKVDDIITCTLVLFCFFLFWTNSNLSREFPSEPEFRSF